MEKEGEWEEDTDRVTDTVTLRVTATTLPEGSRVGDWVGLEVREVVKVPQAVEEGEEVPGLEAVKLGEKDTVGV